MRRQRISVATNVSPEEYAQLQKIAKGRGKTLSRLLSEAMESYLGVKFERRTWERGGDHSRSKAKETHDRICAEMRAAKASKRAAELEVELKRMIEKYTEAEKARREADSAGDSVQDVG